MTGKIDAFSVKGLSQFTRDQIHTPLNHMILLQMYYHSLFSTFSTVGIILSQQQQITVTKSRKCLWSSILSILTLSRCLHYANKDQRNAQENGMKQDHMWHNWFWQKIYFLWFPKETQKSPKGDLFMLWKLFQLKKKIKKKMTVITWSQTVIVSFAVRTIFALYIPWSAAKEPGMDQNWVWMKSSERLTSVSIAFIGKISIATERTLECYSKLFAFSMYRVGCADQPGWLHPPTSLLLSCRSASTALVIRKWKRKRRLFLPAYCH